MNTTLKISNRKYTITGTETKPNYHGVVQTWTDLKGARGGDVTIVQNEGSDMVTVIYMGSARSERIPAVCIHRA